MDRRNKKAAALLLILLCLSLSACSSGKPPDTSPSPSPAPLSLRQEHPQPGYEQFPVYIDSLLMDQGCIRNGELYLNPGIVCELLDIDWSWQGTDDEFLLILDGVEFSGSSSDEYLTGNGRYFYAPQGWFSSQGQIYIPYDLLGRFLCLDISVREGEQAMDISTLNARLIPGGEDYYDLNYPNEELFWLSQIIHAEAWQQPLAGQIGVGNVVMNRVDSPDFPPTIFDVIFDMDHNIVQFEPISNGSVYSQPDEMARIAACLCLDGYNTVGDSLYFVNPSYGSGWFDSSLDLTVTIGDHNFYSVRGADHA